MKKILLFTVVATFSFFSANAQDAIKNGGIKIGANIGLPLSAAGDVASFNIGFDGAYLVEVIDNLEVGGLVGYTHYFGDGTYSYVTSGGSLIIADYDDTSFVPIAASARYSFADRKFFAGLDLGYAVNVAGDADGGFYYRPKFGFNLGPITLLAMYQGISGGTTRNSSYYYTNVYSVSGFNSFNIGIEYGF